MLDVGYANRTLAWRQERKKAGRDRKHFIEKVCVPFRQKKNITEKKTANSRKMLLHAM